MKTIIDLKQYQSPNTETSYYKGIPIEYLEVTRKILKANGLSRKVRYRGPRPAHPGRSRFDRQASCLKVDAKTFTVYRTWP